MPLNNRSLHWLLGPVFVTTPVLPQTGTASYGLVGNTNPTDTNGNVGVLNAATFNANFTNQTVGVALDATLAQRRWFATGQGTIVNGTVLFNGTFTAGNVSGIAPLAGDLSGFFALPAYGVASVAGAGVNYRLTAGSSDRLDGAAVFAAGAPSVPLVPPAATARDVAFAISYVAGVPVGAGVARNTATQYVLDANLDLTQFRAAVPSGSVLPPIPGDFAQGSNTSVDTGYSLAGMLRWGRWSDTGVSTFTTVPGGNVTPLAGDSFPIHWVASANGTAPVMPATGTATYVLAGATAPTNQNATTGVLNNLSLNADFTNATVDMSIGLTVDNVTVAARGGIAPIGGALAANQFAGNFGVVTFNFGAFTLPGAGSFAGFFSGPVSAQDPLPPGVGVTYSFAEGQNQVFIEGAAALVRQ